jgi:hypothetical protein
MQTYGANAWRIHNYVQEPRVIQAEKALEELKQQTVEVNRERKNQQASLSSASFLYVDPTTDQDRHTVEHARKAMDRTHLECSPD